MVILHVEAILELAFFLRFLDKVKVKCIFSAFICKSRKEYISLGLLSHYFNSHWSEPGFIISLYIFSQITL